jgi:chemotaxis protein methyltransferase CheR
MAISDTPCCRSDPSPATAVGPTVRDAEVVVFLQWALPRLGMRCRGFRNVRGQVRKRLRRRIGKLGLCDLGAYRQRLESDESEWSVLGHMCRITISRFCRDREVFIHLGQRLLPELAARAIERSDRRWRAWCAGCACGEEPYSLALIWRFHTQGRQPEVSFRITATDIDDVVIGRARRGEYSSGSLRELPEHWLRQAFVTSEQSYHLRAEYRSDVFFELQDLRHVPPTGPFDLVLCRNLAFTYFDEQSQLDVLERIAQSLAPAGWLVIGAHEQLPAAAKGWAPLGARVPIYRRDGHRPSLFLALPLPGR